MSLDLQFAFGLNDRLLAGVGGSLAILAVAGFGVDKDVLVHFEVQEGPFVMEQRIHDHQWLVRFWVHYRWAVGAEYHGSFGSRS